MEPYVKKKSCRNLDENELSLVKTKLDDHKLNYSFIKSVSLTKESWQLALQYSFNTNIYAPDVVHLVAALQCKADILLTSDSDFKRFGNELLQKINSKLIIESPKCIDVKKLGLKVK